MTPGLNGALLFSVLCLSAALFFRRVYHQSPLKFFVVPISMFITIFILYGSQGTLELLASKPMGIMMAASIVLWCIEKLRPTPSSLMSKKKKP